MSALSRFILKFAKTLFAPAENGHQKSLVAQNEYNVPAKSEQLDRALQLWDGKVLGHVSIEKCDFEPAHTPVTSPFNQEFDEQTAYQISLELTAIHEAFVTCRRTPAGTLQDDTEWAMGILMKRYPQISETAQSRLYSAYMNNNR